MVPKGRPDKDLAVVSSRHGRRVVLSLDVDPRVRDALRDRAASAGVSMAEYLSNALAEPERSYATTAVEIVQPLAQVSYRLAQAIEALESGNVASARDDIFAAKRIVAEAMVPLRRKHAEEVRTNEPRRGGGWAG
jgi:hypothetical protein